MCWEAVGVAAALAACFAALPGAAVLVYAEPTTLDALLAVRMYRPPSVIPAAPPTAAMMRKYLKYFWALFGSEESMRVKFEARRNIASKREARSLQ